MAIEQVVMYMNEGYEWVIDLDIEKYFDTVNHDKLISILKERINDAPTLHLIRSFLQAEVMEDGLISATEMGVPQGGPLSPVLSNVYLDKLDKELENRGLRFARYADDCNIFVRSEEAANRVMASITSWLERKLKLKVSATKTKVVRSTNSTFLGFTFWKSTEGWKPKPAKDRKARLCEKVKALLCRKEAAAMPLRYTFTKLNKKFGCNMTDEQIFKVANSRLGLFAQCGEVVNYLLSPKILSMPNEKENRPGLIDPLAYYLSKT